MSKYLIFSILALVVIIVGLILNGNIVIGSAKFEDNSQIRIKKNSIHGTMEYFLSSEDLKMVEGKTIFFNSWASWCGPCIKEIPLLNKISNRYVADTNILFISYCSDIASSMVDSVLSIDRGLTLNFKNISAETGLRMSLRKLVKELNPKIETDTVHDAVPLNIIFSSDGKLLFYHNAIQYSDTTEIFQILDSI